MQRIFNELTIQEIKKLYNQGVYNKSQLAKKYHCSVTTVCLWLSDNPNQILEIKRIQRYNNSKKISTCDCGKRIKGHDRCKLCTILNHSGNNLCDWCVQHFLRKYK